MSLGMPDLRVRRPRTGVQIWLFPADIVDMVTQQDVIATFTTEEIKKLIECLNLELNFKENQGEKNEPDVT